MGFLLFQFVLIDKFRSYFWRPLPTVLAINTILFGFAGWGSYASDFIAGYARGRLRVFAVFFFLAAYTWIALAHIPFSVAAPAVKLLATAAIIAPFAFFIGLFMPRGLRLLDPGKMGQALFWDSVGAFLAIPVYYMTAWILGISFNFALVAALYLSASVDLISADLRPHTKKAT
jgi:hypothetical protein